MAHPHRKEAEAGHNAKLERLTKDYGDADAGANIKSPDDILNTEGPQESVGFGSEAGVPKARGDRGSRTCTIANPVATYARGGRACKADGGDVSLIEQANRNQTQASGRARGGRAKKGSTHVNVIVAPGGGPGAGAAPGPVVPPTGSAAPPPAPMMPPRPPMGGMPMAGGPPGAMPPGLIPPRARGGKVHPDEAQDRKLIKKMMKEEEKKEGETPERASGGKVHMTAGAESGEGRLQKAAIHAREKGKMRAQAV